MNVRGMYMKLLVVFKHVFYWIATVQKLIHVTESSLPASITCNFYDIFLVIYNAHPPVLNINFKWKTTPLCINLFLGTMDISWIGQSLSNITGQISSLTREVVEDVVEGRNSQLEDRGIILINEEIASTFFMLGEIYKECYFMKKYIIQNIRAPWIHLIKTHRFCIVGSPKFNSGLLLLEEPLLFRYMDQ